MREIIEIAFSGFWAWLGSFIIFYCLLSGMCNLIFVVWNRFWRHWNIRKHGYPPPHCDADGDFRKEKE